MLDARIKEISGKNRGVQLENKTSNLGEGGFGSVEERVDLQTLKIYAVKSFSNK